MEFNDIKYFVETCNHNSFSEAANSLFITQQALSKCIAKLEKELECSLFMRTVKGIELTKDGYYLCDQFLPIVLSFGDTARQTSAHMQKRPVKLSFCCAPGIIRTISPELLIAFGEHYPNIEFDIAELSDLECDDYIQKDARRFGLMGAPAWKHQQLHNFFIVKTEPTYLMVHKHHPFSTCPSISLGMLRNERILSFGKTSYFLEILNNAVRPFNFFVKPVYESCDVTLLCELVEKEKGVLLCTRQNYEECRLNNIVLVPLRERTVDYCVAFVFQDYIALDTAAKQFIQFVMSNIGSY